MGADSIVSVTLYPQLKRDELGMRVKTLVQVPTGSGEHRHMVCSGLLTELNKQFPDLKKYAGTLHVSRTATTGAYEILSKQTRLYPNDDISLHIIPKAPEHKPAMAISKRKQGEYDRFTKPLYRTMCTYQPSAEWPSPLPPTSVLLGKSGSAHDHAFSKFVLHDTEGKPVTRCFWVIPGSVLAGPVPDSDKMCLDMLTAGVRHFVDLRAKGEAGVSGAYREMVRARTAAASAERGLCIL